MSSESSMTLLTAREVSDLTGIAPSTLHEWAVKREANLPVNAPAHVRLGERRRRWARADVEAWLESNRVGS